jgi:hypothetical protein
MFDSKNQYYLPSIICCHYLSGKRNFVPLHNWIRGEIFGARNKILLISMVSEEGDLI